MESKQDFEFLHLSTWSGCAGCRWSTPQGRWTRWLGGTWRAGGRRWRCTTAASGPPSSTRGRSGLAGSQAPDQVLHYTSKNTLKIAFVTWKIILKQQTQASCFGKPSTLITYCDHSMPCSCEALKLTGNFVATDNGIENLVPTNKVSASDPLQMKWR